MATFVTRVRSWGTIVGAALACGACTAVGPNFHTPPNDPPPAWTGPAARAQPADAASRAVAAPFDGYRWWTMLDDALLDQLIDEATRQNLDLQGTVLRIAAARAQRDATAGALLPSVAGNVVGGRARLSPYSPLGAVSGGSSGAGSGAGSTGGSSSSSEAAAPVTNLYQVGFDALWELDLWGKTRRGIEAADATTEATDAQRQEMLVSLSAEIARDYVALRGAQAQRAIIERDIASLEHLLGLTRSRRDAGLSPDSDVQSQTVQLDATRAQLPQIEQRIAQAMNQLAQLLALPPGALSERLGNVVAISPLPPQVPTGLPGDLLRRRPDIRRSEAQLHNATAQVGVATAQLFPSVRLGLFGGLQGTRTADLFDWSSRFAAGGVGITLPIFQGGQLRAQVRIADLQSQQAALTYRQTVLAAYHEADNAIDAYAREQQRAALLHRQVDSAARNLRLAQSRYRSGLAPLLDVLDAERSWLNAQTSLNQSTVDAATDLVALCKSLGGGWQEAVGTATR